MKFKTDILGWIPFAFRDIEEFKALAAAENLELDELYQAIENLMNDQFVNDATEVGIKRWEKLLGINAPSEATLDERRWEILNRLNIKIPYTITMLRNKLTALYGSDFILKVINDTYTVKVRIPSASIKTLPSTQAMLDVIVPANMMIDLGTYDPQNPLSSTSVLGLAVLGVMKLGRTTT